MVLQIEECGVLLCLVGPSIVELDGLLGVPACKERGQLSEDFVSVVRGGGQQNFGCLWGIWLLQYWKWTIFPWSIFCKTWVSE